MMGEKKSFRFNLSGYKKKFRHSREPLGDLVAQIGRYFLGAPYQGATLEKGNQERLIVNFDQFDCFTFVETVLALAKCVAAGKFFLPEFRQYLQLIRYRHGIIDGYSSRLHYFTDWLHNNKKKGIITDLSRRIAAKPQYKVINYMTAHRNCYPALHDKNVFREIRKIEKLISRRKLYILPQAECRSELRKIKTGDIISFASRTKGLDIAHVGFALWQKDELYLLHASSKEKKVVISSLHLIDYLRQNKKYAGIMVARLNQ